jgi:hypothetical protein
MAPADDYNMLENYVIFRKVFVYPPIPSELIPTVGASIIF